MTDTDLQGDQGNYTSLILAQIRLNNRKLDLVIDTLQQHGDRFVRIERDMAEGFGRAERDTARLEREMSEGFARVERDIGGLRDDIRGVRRDVNEVKSDMTLMENKILTVQSEILSAVVRLNDFADARSAEQPAVDPKGA